MVLRPKGTVDPNLRKTASESTKVPRLNAIFILIGLVKEENTSEKVIFIFIYFFFLQKSGKKTLNMFWSHPLRMQLKAFENDFILSRDSLINVKLTS